MVAHEQPLFDKLLWRLVTSTIFVRCQRLIARKLAELFGFNRGVRPFFAACCFDELSRGSISCLLDASFGKRFHNATTRFFTPEIDDHGVRRGDTGRIIARWRRPVASSEALDVLHKQCARHCTGASSWPLKWPTKEVHLFVTAAFFAWCNCSKGPCYGPLKLIASYIIVVYYVIKQFVSYWPPLTTMDAVLATIADGGQAIVVINREGVEIN